jgi:hypothetical protein
MSSQQRQEYLLLDWLLVAALVFLYFVLLAPSHPEKTLSSKISLIPQEDRYILEDFFQTLLLREGGAYTLFGDKPITYDAYFESDCIPCLLTSMGYWEQNKRCELGWKTWKKYSHLFPSNHFLLQAKKRDDQWVEIILVNKDQFIQTINENLKEFKSILGRKFVPENFLRQYEKDDNALFHLLNKHHGLFGILLGFGKRNALMYQERDRILVDFYHFTLKTNPQPIVGFETIADERAFFESAFVRSFNDIGRLTYIHLPYFMVDPKSTETCAIREKYLRQRKHIQDIYSHGDFLEITLAKFCN